MYNKSNIFKNAWFIYNYYKLKKLANYSFSKALKLAWKKEKEKIYNNAYKIINKVSWYYSIKYKLDYDDIYSYCNELLLQIIKKYKSLIGTFEGFLFKQLNFYINNYCKKEKLKKEHDLILKFQLPTLYKFTYQEKINISKLTKQILDYCIDKNIESKILYQKRKYKNKIYKYAINLEKITQKNIKEYFKNLGYSLNDILNAFNEIKILLKKELI